MAKNLLGQLHEWAMSNPCAQDRHDPFVLSEDSSAPSVLTFGYVRTSSFDLDGCGGRTDVHDLFSLLWACILRASGAASARLISESGFTGIEEEIYARWLVFEQIGDFKDSSTQKQRLLAHTSRAYHILDDMLEWERIKYPNATWEDGADELVGRLNKVGKFKDFGEMAGLRNAPDWLYAKSHQGRVTVAVFPVESMLALRRALIGYSPETAGDGNMVSVLAGGLKNAVSKKAISTGLRYMRAVEDDANAFPWHGLGSSALEPAVVAIPLESHCVFLGLQTLVSVETKCGLQQYESERTKFLQRRVKENAVFSADYTFAWQSTIDGGRFEDLVYALLEREQGVVWVKQASPTRERDGGRDFLAKWIVPVGQGPEGEPLRRSADGVPTPAKMLSVIVQVKASKSSVGKAKVQDIRDTVDRFQADGYFLVAFPQPTTSLVEHFSSLSQRGVWTDWWDRAHIESRLRKNLDLLARFSDLVRMDEHRF